VTATRTRTQSACEHAARGSAQFAEFVALGTALGHPTPREAGRRCVQEMGLSCTVRRAFPPGRCFGLSFCTTPASMPKSCVAMPESLFAYKVSGLQSMIGTPREVLLRSTYWHHVFQPCAFGSLVLDVAVAAAPGESRPPTPSVHGRIGVATAAGAFPKVRTALGIRMHSAVTCLCRKGLSCLQPHLCADFVFRMRGCVRANPGPMCQLPTAAVRGSVRIATCGPHVHLVSTAQPQHSMAPLDFCDSGGVQVQAGEHEHTVPSRVTL